MAIQNTSKEKTWIGVWDETSGLSMNGAARAVEFPGSNTKGQLPMDRSLMRLGLAYSSYSQACTYDFALRMINQELQRNPISSVTTPIRFAGVQLPLPKRSNTTTPKCELADSAQCPIEGSTTITYQMELLNNLVNKALSKKPNGAIGFLGTGFSDLNLRIRTFQGSSQLGFPALQVDNVAIDPTLINNKHNKFYMTAGSTQLDGVFAVCSLLKSFGWERAGAVFFTNGLGKSFKRAWYDQIEEAGISANGLLELPVAPSGRLDIKRMEESGFAEGVMRAYQLTGVSVTVAFFAGWAANTDDMAWVGRKLHNSGMMDAGRALIFPPGFTKVLKDKLCSLQMAQDGLCLDTTFQASTGVWASGPLSHFRQSGLDAFMGSLFLEDWPPDAEFLRSVRGQCSTTADSLGLTNYELYQWNDWEVESLPRAFNSVWTYYEAVRAVIEQSDSSAGKIIYDSSAFRGTLQDVRFVSNVTHLYQNYPRHCDFHPSLGTLKMPTSNNLAYEFKIRNLRLANSTTVEFADVGGLSTLLEIGDVRWTVNQDWGKLSASDTGCQREGRRTTSTKTSDRPTLYSYRDGGHNVRPARRGAPSIVWPGSVTTIPIDFTACRDGWYFSRDRGLCSPCPRSFYSGGTDLECIKCPPYTMTATSAATSISMCICQVGTYRPYEGSVGCELCKENYYCNGTPLNTTEEGVSLDWWVEPPRAEQGYWTACNYPPDDCAIYECPVKDQCVIDSQCDGKSHGTLCAECNDDYLSSNYGMACTECPGSGSFIVLFIICIAIGITYGTYLVMSTTNEGVFERCAPRLSIAIVTIGFFQTFQVLQAASVIRVDWVHPIDWLPNLPTLLGLILSGSGHLTLMRSFVQCYTDSYTSLSVIIVTTMSTGVIAVLCGIVAGMQWCQEKPADVKAVVDKVEDVLPVVKTPSEQRRAKLLAWATVLHFLYAPAAAEVMLSVGSCTLIDDKLYNMYNLSLECFGGEHIATVVCVVLPTLLVLCLAIPWYEHNYIYHVTKSATYKERQFEHMSTQALGICHLSFEARYWYYFNVVFFRKVGLAICAASIHAGGIKFQAYAAMVVLNAALLVHFRQQPFYYDDVDQLESYSLIISQGYAAALALAGDFGDDGGKSVLAVCILIAQFGFIAKAIWVFRRNSDKNINNKGAMDLPRNLPEGLGGEDDLPPESEMGEMDIENLRAAGMLPCLGENAPLEAHKKMESFTNKWEIKINELVDSRNKRDIEEAEAARRKGPGAVIELDMKSDDFEEDEHSPLSPKDSVDDPTSSRADFIKQRRHRGHRSRSSRSTPKGATMLEMEEVPKPRAQVSRSEASRDSRQSSRSTTVADVSSSEATGFVWKQQSKPGTTRSSQRSGKSGLALQDGTIDYSVTNITEDVSGRPQMATRPTPNSPTGRTRSHSDRSQELESGAELSESVAASSRPRRPESPARMNVSLAEDSTGLDSKETAGQAPGVNIQQHKSSKPRSKGKRPSRKASNPGGERYVKKMQDSSSVQDSEIQHI